MRFCLEGLITISDPMKTMPYAKQCLVFRHAYQASYDGTTITFTGPYDRIYTIEHVRGDVYRVSGPGVSKTVDISHLMGDNNGAWLASNVLKVLGLL
jgi:hypothetical protein